MPSGWPQEMQRDADGSGVTYQLPVRPLGPLRLVGLFPLLFGLAFVSVPASEFIRQIARLAAGDVQGASWFSMIFNLPFLLAGAIPLVLGLFILAGRCRVSFRDRQIRVIEHVGPFRWTRRFDAQGIRKIELALATHRGAGVSLPSGGLFDLGVLMLHTDAARPKPLVIGYPKAWLHAMAMELSALTGVRTGVGAAPVVEVTTLQTRDVVQTAEVRQQPAGSTVRVEPNARGLTLVIPPAGLIKGSKGLFLFSLLWCAFMVVFTAGIGASILREGEKELIPILLFLLLFWGVGLGMMAGAINMGRRRAMLLVENGSLRIAQSGPFGNKRWDWAPGQITALRADASGMKVNNRHVIELQIHPREGKKLGLLAGRDEPELQWIATLLRQALKLPDREGAGLPQVPSAPDNDAPPPIRAKPSVGGR